MEPAELEAAVARAILPGLNGGRGPSGTPEEGADALARAAVGVVLAEVRQQFEAMPVRHNDLGTTAWVEWLVVQGVLDGLEPPPPV